MKLKTTLLQITLFIATSYNISTSHAQNQHTIDSLKQVVATAEQDTNKVKTLNNLAVKYQIINLDTSLIYAGQTLELATKLSYKKGMSWAYKNIGIVHYYRGDFTLAINNWEKQLLFAEELGNKQVMSKCYNNLGLVHTYLGSYIKAINYYNKSLKIAEDLGDKEVMSLCYKNIGIVNYYQGSYTQAINYFNKSLKIAEEFGDKLGMTKCYNNIGVIHMNQGSYTQAINYYNKSLKIAEELGDKKVMATCYGNIGSIHNYQGSYTQAINYYNKQLKIAEEINDKQVMGICYNNIGIIHYLQGNYPKAIDYYNKSLKMREYLDDKKGMSMCYLNIGSVHNSQGSYTKAINYYNKSLEIHEELGDKKGMAKCYSDIGIVHNSQGSYTKAMNYYNKSLKIYEELGDKKGMSDTYISFGIVHKDHGNYSKAINYYNKSLKIYEELGDKDGMATIFGNIADLHIQLSNIANSKKQQIAELDTAIIFGNKSMKISKEIYAKPRIKSANNYLSRAYWGLKQNNNAASNFNELISLDNANILMNFSFISEKEKENFFATIEKDYWQYNSFALEYKNTEPGITETVYNNTVKNKGLLLKSNTAMHHGVQNSNDTLLIKKYEDWIFLKKQIAKKYSKGEDTKELENQANNLEGYLVKNSQKFSDFNKVQNISWKDVQAGLKEKEVAIEFLHFPLLIPDSSLTDFTNTTQYVALIVTPKSKQPEMVRLFAEKEYENCINNVSAANLVAQLYGKKRGVNVLTSGVDFTNYADSLYSLIWSSMDPYLEEVETVYYSPSGLLHNISFAAIPYNDSLLLSDKYELVYVASTGNILNEKPPKDIAEFNVAIYGGLNYDIDTTAMLANANKYNSTDENLIAMNRSISVSDSTRGGTWTYLNGTLDEAKNIRSMFEKNSISANLYTANNGIEESFKSLSGKHSPEIIHLATHGFFFPDPEKEKHDNRAFMLEEKKVFKESDNPLIRSGLIMSGANMAWKGEEIPEGIDDGILTAYEVSGLDLYNTELVVLSACETGLGDIKGSEGVYGLQRSFKMAGVDYLIMSLWQVPDKETSEFMTLFYTHLLKTTNIREAFTKTQRTMRQKYDPYYWAAFVLIE